MQKVSIIIPIYNEKKTLDRLVSRVENSSVGELVKQIILVDDCSTDGTKEILKQYENKHTVVYREKNGGKGAAVRTGISRVTGEVVLIQDADLEYDPAEYSRMLDPILKGLADVVYGSRFLGDYPHRVLYFWHYLGNKVITFLSDVFTNVNLTDIETGFKAFRTEVLQSIELRENRFGFEPEVTAKVVKGKWRIYEVGISYAGRTYEEGKKIGWKDGFEAIWCIIRYNIFD